MEDKTISERLLAVEARIAAACVRAGRARKAVTLIAVSKQKPETLIEAAAACGQTVFGENRVQELVQKSTRFQTYTPRLQWHMIGHLQRNKARQALPHITMLHSLDSIALAAMLDTEAQRLNRILPVLVEINMANEPSKYGILPTQAETFIREIANMQGISVKGLMTVAPETENPEENRTIFRKMAQLAVDIREKNIDNVSMDELSMGMSGDFEIAVEEGATMVRIGTTIFGAR